MDARTIEKLPATKLREEAMKIEGLTGVHGMNKEELIRVLKQHHGIKDEVRPHASGTHREVKVKIRELKSARAKANADGDAKRAKVLRKKVKRLKRLLRRSA